MSVADPVQSYANAPIHAQIALNQLIRVSIVDLYGKIFDRPFSPHSGVRRAIPPQDSSSAYPVEKSCTPELKNRVTLDSMSSKSEHDEFVVFLMVRFATVSTTQSRDPFSAGSATTLSLVTP